MAGLFCPNQRLCTGGEVAGRLDCALSMPRAENNGLSAGTLKAFQNHPQGTVKKRMFLLYLELLTRTQNCTLKK